MTPNEYQQAAMRTDLPDWNSHYHAWLRIMADAKSGGPWDTFRLLHASIGITTESGELADLLKKHIFYGKPLDTVNAVEECGDLLWYVALACDALGVTIGEVMERNIAKLRTRYPDKFTSDAAINRDLEAERRALEGK
jgi:NTP pyrophosphatase (non-canonical NTP hydrolase)